MSTYRKLLRWSALLPAAATVSLSAAALAQPSFRGLGFLGQEWWPSDSTAISGDGSTVVGSSGGRAFRWSAAVGIESLATPAGHEDVWARGVSSDGSVIVGYSSDGRRAFRWTGSGIEDLGTLPGHLFASASDVSADGAIVVGTSFTWGQKRAFRWTSAEGMHDLGFPPSGDADSGAGAISADGAVIVGSVSTVAGRRAFRWTAQEGMVTLGTLSGSDYSDATATNVDGTVIVGHSTGSSGYHIYRWTNQTGMMELGPGIVAGVNADGSVVVGNAFVQGQPRAFRWTAGGGMSMLGNWEATGVDASGDILSGIAPHPQTGQRRAIRWTAQTGVVDLGALPGRLSSAAAAISGDGSTVVGEADGWGARWDLNDGAALEVLGAGPAYGVNADGSVVVGGDWGAFRWTSGEGMQPLGALPGWYWPLSSALTTSADGSIVVGYSAECDVGKGGWFNCFNARAFRWTASDGMQPLGWGDWWNWGIAWGLSADGSVVVGQSGVNAVRHTAAEGTVVLGTGAARAASADGSVIAGTGFRWTQVTGMQALSPLPDDGWAEAVAISADGAIIVGRSGDGPWTFESHTAVLWTGPGEAVDLNSSLPALGIDLTGWTLTEVTGISADGRTIVGAGINPAGQREAWVAHMPGTNPCPADWDGDGSVTSSDISAFITTWLVNLADGDLLADFDNNGQVNSSDISAFLTAWLDAVVSGC